MKYKLTEETKNLDDGTILHRIKAIRDISRHGVKKGDLGGWVQSESNLSQVGDAWVSDKAEVSGDAQVFGYAWVYDNARVYGDARVYDNARVYGDARVYDNARVYGDARVYDNARVFGDARVYGYAEIFGDSRVYDKAQVFGDAWVSDNAQVSGDAQVFGYALVYDNARVYGDARVYGYARVFGNTRVFDNAEVFDYACVYGNARVSGNNEICGDSDISESDVFYTHNIENLIKLVNKTDWHLFAKQKRSLIDLVQSQGEETDSELLGLIHWVDRIQDILADTISTPEKVFPDVQLKSLAESFVNDEVDVEVFKTEMKKIIS